MTVKKTIYHLSNILKSKFVVFLAIAALWFVGSTIDQVNADGYTFGAVYQNYLLGSKADDLQGEAEDQKFLKLGSLGSGGISGTFSYYDIVNSASDEDKATATDFVSMMSTYSTFGYFSNKIQGFEAIIPMVGRVVTFLILIIPALLMDVLSLIVPGMLSLLAKFNVVTWLATAYMDTGFVSGISEATGISRETIRQFSTAVLSFALMMILISFAGMLKGGASKGLDRRHSSKLKGRLITFFALPVIVGCAATIIIETTNLASQNQEPGGNFSKYLVDVRSWAYNFNFAPRGDSAQASDISPTTKSSYVDLRFNPYTAEGQERIEKINSKSSLLSADMGKVFANTALIVSYGTGESFSAIDFIDYKGTEASQHYYGRDDGNGATFGSYYQYANILKDRLTKVGDDDAMTGSGEATVKGGAAGSYASAIGDYASGDTLNVSPQIAWRDRFIYGAKSSGTNIEKYYEDTPSQEMIRTTVGATGSGNAISNQSMFLVLSTIFNETGGRYYIDAPARGTLALKASFDSNRSDYYVVSMVGNPFFTFFGLLSEPLLQLVVLVSLVTAIMSIGLLEMNILPASAYVKGITIGDLEYAQAFLVYSIGIAGTIVTFYAVPPFLIMILKAVANLIVAPAYLFNLEAITPQASLGLKGAPLLFTAAIAVLFAVLYIKSSRFRALLIWFYIIVWEWAKSTGRRLEHQAGGVVASQMKMGAQRSIQKNPLHQALNKANQMNKGGVGEDGESDPDDPNSGDPTGSGGSGSGSTSQSQSDGQTGSIGNRNPYQTADDELFDLQNDPELSDEAQQEAAESQNKIDELKANPTPENVQDAQDQLLQLRQQLENEDADPETIAKVDKALENLNVVAADYEFDDQKDENQDSSDSTGTKDETNKDVGNDDKSTEEHKEIDHTEDHKEVDHTEEHKEIDRTEGHKEVKEVNEIETSKNTEETEKHNEINEVENNEENIDTLDNDTVGSDERKTINEDWGPRTQDRSAQDINTSVGGDNSKETSQDSIVKEGENSVIERTAFVGDNNQEGNSQHGNSHDDASWINAVKTNLNNSSGNVINNSIENNTHIDKTLNRSENRSETNNYDNSREVSNSNISNNSDINYVHNQNYKNLVNSLGKASKNSDIGKALAEIRDSRSEQDAKKGLLKLSRSYMQLDATGKSGSNEKEVLKSIGEIIKTSKK